MIRSTRLPYTSEEVSSNQMISKLNHENGKTFGGAFFRDHSSMYLFHRVFWAHLGAVTPLRRRFLHLRGPEYAPLQPRRRNGSRHVLFHHFSFSLLLIQQASLCVEVITRFCCHLSEYLEKRFNIPYWLMIFIVETGPRLTSGSSVVLSRLRGIHFPRPEGAIVRHMGSTIGSNPACDEMTSAAEVSQKNL